jgi:gamma-glutamyltranspeptidase / glutathione hydrolase
MTLAKGLVAAPRREAVEAGQAVFRAGGNAVDAAVAASFVLGVVEPYMTGPGAVGEMLYLDAAGCCHVVDCAARAPFAATPDMFRVVSAPLRLDYAWPGVEAQANIFGALSVTAPRLVAGLFALHQRFGRLPWAALVAPAVHLARTGFGIDYFSAAVLAHEMRTLQQDAEARELYYPGGAPIPPPIDSPPVRLCNPGLADALQAIAEAGPTALSEGKLADAIIEEVGGKGGILSSADLAAATAGVAVLEDVRPAVHFRGFRIYISPLPSGGLTAAQILGILDRLSPLGGAPSRPARYERFALASAHAFADRLSGMSGSDGPEAVSELLSAKRLDTAATAVQAGRVSRALVGAGHHPSTATTCLTAVDGDGGLVSLTQTLLSFFGSQLGIRGYGFHLNDGMLWFDPRPGSPNSIQGGKRALAAVSPLVAVSPDGTRRIAFSGLGARRIISAVAQATENYIEYRLPLQKAIDLPRVHTDTGDTLVDERLPKTVANRLRRLGLSPGVACYSPTSTGIARLTAAEYDSGSRTIGGAIDLRSSATWRFGR